MPVIDTRPSGYTWLIGVAVVLGIAASVYWKEIFDFAGALQIKRVLGL